MTPELKRGERRGEGSRIIKKCNMEKGTNMRERERERELQNYIKKKDGSLPPP